MRADVRKPQRARITDQLTEHAVAARRLAEHLSRLVADAARQEALEALAPRIQHAERGIASAGELACGSDHPLEDELGLGFLEHAVAERDQRSKRLVLHKTKL